MQVWEGFGGESTCMVNFFLSRVIDIEAVMGEALPFKKLKVDQAPSIPQISVGGLEQLIRIIRVMCIVEDFLDRAVLVLRRQSNS